VTVSAIVFLYTSSTKPAAIAILNMDDNGDYASAAAMSVLILLINVAVRILYEIINKKLIRRLEKYKTGEVSADNRSLNLQLDQIDLELLHQIEQKKIP
ncbi:MAG: hypothetical protein Q4B70_14905, partial [Lachnospiraceae bacterium]|nr:hypothetical protein [Lachnospiraceae bacterium]